MERRDPGFRKSLFLLFGNRFRERALETHQFLPINANSLGPNPFPFHSADPVKGFCSADKNLFRVASPERARPPERPRIDNSHLPSSRPPPQSPPPSPSPPSHNHHPKLPPHTQPLI